MIGAASRVRYSVSVVALTAADALAVFDESVKEATCMQKRLPSLLGKMEELKVCIPLFAPRNKLGPQEVTVVCMCERFEPKTSRACLCQ